LGAFGRSTGVENEGLGDGLAAGVAEVDGLSVGLGDGVASTAIAGAANASTSAEETVATVRERLKTDILIKIDRLWAIARLPRRFALVADWQCE
jgi:hypothetical protein